MWARLTSLLLLGGCAQIFGIDETSNHAPVDGAVADSVGTDTPLDAAPCVGGDTRATDPATGACYVFFSTPMTRDAARTACQGLGTSTLLASVQTTTENQLIAGLIGATPAVFLGGNDEQVENQFVWDDGTHVVLTNWNTGEPNNGAGQFEEDCITMLGTPLGTWDDRPCAPVPNVPNTGVYPFVCERD